jgi:hypothetical protein
MKNKPGTGGSHYNPSYSGGRDPISGVRSWVEVPYSKNKKFHSK